MAGEVRESVDRFDDLNKRSLAFACATLSGGLGSSSPPILTRFDLALHHMRFPKPEQPARCEEPPECRIEVTSFEAHCDTVDLVDGGCDVRVQTPEVDQASATMIRVFDIERG